MTTFTVVPINILRYVRARVSHAVVGSKIGTFVLDRVPNPSDEDFVTPGAASVRGQVHAMANHRVDELLGSELADLVGVDYVQSAETGIRFLQRLDRVHGLQRDRHSVRQNPPTARVHHRRQVHKATRHANVGRIQRPDLVAALDCQLEKQVRKHLVLRASTTGARLRRQCRITHLAHQRADAQPDRIMALSALSKHASRAAQQLLLPHNNLRGMQFKLLAQIRQSLVFTQRGQSHLGP